MQDDSVQGRAVVLQPLCERRRAGGSIAFAIQELGRVPAVIFRQVALDELTECPDILIHAPEHFVLAFADGVAVPRTHRVDEDQVGIAEQAFVIGGNGIRCRRRGAGVGHIHAIGPETTHMQPDRRRSWAAVVQKRYGSPRQIVYSIPGIGNIEHDPGGFVVLAAQQDRTGRCRVTDRVPVDGDAVVR